MLEWQRHDRQALAAYDGLVAETRGLVRARARAGALRCAVRLGDAARAERELFAWWSEMIELPVVAEGGLDRALVEAFAPVTDFFAIGPEIWRGDDPLAALRDLTAPVS
jgi:hypothetical protein